MRHECAINHHRSVAVMRFLASQKTVIAMSGATLAELAEAMGHKTLQMVFRYAHLCPKHQATVVDRMAQKFLTGT